MSSKLIVVAIVLILAVFSIVGIYRLLVPSGPVGPMTDLEGTTIQRTVDSQGRPDPVTESEKRIRSIVDSEEVNQSLAPLLVHLGNLLMSQELDKIDFVASDFQYQGLQPFTLPGADANSDDLFSRIDWPIASQASSATAEQIWKPVAGGLFHPWVKIWNCGWIFW